jgi:hypothetical protein
MIGGCLRIWRQQNFHHRDTERGPKNKNLTPSRKDAKVKENLGFIFSASFVSLR